MADWDAAAYVNQTIGQTGSGHDFQVGDTWVTVRPANVRMPDDGWKLHLSSRAANFPELLAKALPLLLAERCHFKVARSRNTLARLNSGVDAPAAVGKAVTVYPCEEQIRNLGFALVAVLAGHEGPRVLSDRRIDEAAPVYYRYGPFGANWQVGQHGLLGIDIAGPDGETFDGLATLEYRQPEWSVDPFTDVHGNRSPVNTGEAADEHVLLGGRFRVTRGIYQAAHGNVYRAVDEASGASVIVKQARALVGETKDGADARTRLRNERRILTACTDLDGVPGLVDHFAHGPDEFLVTTDAGETNLLDFVFHRGYKLPAGSAPPDSFPVAVAQLARTVAGMHDLGIVIRDLTPRNVVVDGDRYTLIDFGLAAKDGIHLPGGTPGFAPPRQLRDEEPRRTDDHFALGMLLVFLAAARSPINDVESAGLARTRTLQALHAIYGDDHRKFVTLIDGLLCEDDDRGDRALRALAFDDWSGTGRPAALPWRPRPTPPVPDLEAVEAQVLETLLEQADELTDQAVAEDFTSVDASVYLGSAGVGMELLQHLDRGGERVRATLSRLGDHVLSAAQLVSRRPGLLTGATGIELFVEQGKLAGIQPFTAYALPEPAVPTMDELDGIGDDLTSGTAGFGLAQLHLYDLTGEDERLDIARYCAESLIGRREMRITVEDDGLPASAGIDQGYGQAHGLAGVVDFLLGYLARNDATEVRTWTRAAVERLRRRTDELCEIAALPSAVPLSAGWCKGLSGMALALLRAGLLFGESGSTATAKRALVVAAGWIPRLENLGQCCGVSGLGSALIECYRLTGDEAYLDRARAVLVQMLIRSGGPDHTPVFTDGQQDGPLSWGMGNAGILEFLRRLRRPAGPAALPSPLGESYPARSMVPARREAGVSEVWH